MKKIMTALISTCIVFTLSACGAPAPEDSGTNSVLKSAGNGTLTISNSISGGSASSEDFTYLASDGENPLNGIEADATTTLAEGFWALGTDDRPPGYTSTVWSGDCSDVGDGTATLMLSENQDAECTATHTLRQDYTAGYGEITINMLIDDTFGGTAVPADFDPKVGSTSVNNYEIGFFPMDTYTISQNDLEDYWELIECPNEEVTISTENPFGACSITNIYFPF